MAWIIEWDNKAEKELNKLPRPIQYQVLKYLRERTTENPRRFGKALSYDKAGLWRYRVGDYRIVCTIEDHHLVILVLSVAHRKNVYR